MVRVSAPGKSILMGEHAAVYGRPALVAAVARRLTVEARATAGEGIALDLPQVGVRETLSAAEIRDYARRARAGWEAYERAPGPEAFRRLRGEDRAHVVKVALGEAIEYLDEEGARGLELRLESEIPIGAGFGSSAAAAVAVLHAVLLARGHTASVDELYALSLEIERRQHGLPSGVDNATVIHGGLLWATRDGAGAVVAEPLAARPRALAGLRLYNTGEPAEPTGAVVAEVRRRLEADRGRVEPLLDQMETHTRALREELLREEEDPEAIRALVHGFELCLEELGVVPGPVRERVREIERRGGAAKVSGAGALTGRGAGSLMVYHRDPEEIDRWDAVQDLERLDARLGAEGLRVEGS